MYVLKPIALRQQFEYWRYQHVNRNVCLWILYHRDYSFNTEDITHQHVDRNMFWILQHWNNSFNAEDINMLTETYNYNVYEHNSAKN